jgi:hypothetical protein
MIQFVLVFVHGILPLFTDCDYPKVCWVLDQIIKTTFATIITQLQIIQFVLVFVHGILPLFTDCDYPKVSWVLDQIIKTTFATIITQLQIIQFVLVIVHGILPLFADCDYPKVSWVLDQIIKTTYAIIITQLQTRAQIAGRIFNPFPNPDPEQLEVCSRQKIGVRESTTRTTCDSVNSYFGV